MIVGAFLEQIIDIKIIAFFSRKLNFSQRSYRKLLGIYLVIKHFRYILEGRRIIIRKDDKLLIYAFQTFRNQIKSHLDSSI